MMLHQQRAYESFAEFRIWEHANDFCVFLYFLVQSFDAVRHLYAPGIQEVLPFHFHRLVHGEPEKFHQKVGSPLNQGFQKLQNQK